MTGDPLAEIVAALRKIEDAKQTILCEPNAEARVRALVDEAGMAIDYQVQASEFCPPGQVLILPPVKDYEAPPPPRHGPFPRYMPPVINDPRASIKVTGV